MYIDYMHINIYTCVYIHIENRCILIKSSSRVVAHAIG